MGKAEARGLERTLWRGGFGGAVDLVLWFDFQVRLAQVTLFRVA